MWFPFLSTNWCVCQIQSLSGGRKEPISHRVPNLDQTDLTVAGIFLLVKTGYKSWSAFLPRSIVKLPANLVGRFQIYVRQWLLVDAVTFVWQVSETGDSRIVKVLRIFQLPPLFMRIIII